MGGSTTNDVWRSTDKGVTWVRQTESADWAARYGHTSVSLADGSIFLMGGYAQGYNSDVWRSADQGVTWSRQTAGAPWAARFSAAAVSLPDGNIVLMGGYSPYQRDVWRLSTASSTARIPSHVYAAPGTYTVALRASNAAGFSDAVRTGYVTVAAVLAVPPGTMLPTDTNGDGIYDDVNGNGRKDFADVVLYFNQMSWIAGNEPLWAFDYNGNGRIDFADVVWLFNNL